jgi:hypothetical protein
MMKTKFWKMIAVNLILLSVGLLTVIGCKNDEPIQPPEKGPCAVEKILLSRLTIETYPGPLGFDSIRCPTFNAGKRPFHVGDTIAVTISNFFGLSNAEPIGSKPVFVTVTSRLGDSETFLLQKGFWPCEMRQTEVEIFRTIIFYSTSPLCSPVYPFPNNGHREIRTTGDTLIASYLSYCA